MHIFIDPRLSVQINTNGSRITFMLVIRDLSEVDSGYYSCIVKIYEVKYSDWPTQSSFLAVKSKYKGPPPLIIIHCTCNDELGTLCQVI